MIERDSVAHDLRNIVACALGSLDGTRDARALEHARDAMRSAVELLEAQLGDRSALSSLPHPIAKDVFFVLDVLWYDVESRHRLELEVRASPFVEVDRWVVRRALLNVLLNARAASPAGAPIGVEVGEDEGEAYVRVRDQGPGISPEDLAAIRSHTPVPGREPGHGIGLLGTRHGLELARGGLEVESSIGGGTMVTIRLPALQPKTPRSEESLPWQTELPRSSCSRYA